MLDAFGIGSGVKKSQRSAAEELQTLITTSKEERSALSEMLTQVSLRAAKLNQTHKELAEVEKAAAAATTKLDEVGGRLSNLDARANAVDNLEERLGQLVDTVSQTEKRLAPLAQLQELASSTEERLASLNALAEHVTYKTKALDSQKQTIDHAIVQTNRLNEMVWAMDSQIAKLNEGSKQVAEAEDTLSRMEKLAAETQGQLDKASQGRDDLAREIARVETEGRTVCDAIRGHVEKLNVDKRTFETFDQRLAVLSSSVADAEHRVAALAEKEQQSNQLSQRVDVLAKRYQHLLAQSDELDKKHDALSSLRGEFEQINDLAGRTNAQMTTLNQNRRDLDAIHLEVSDLRKSFGEVAQLRDKLGSDRLALEGFVDRVAALTARAPELDAKMEAIQKGFGRLDEGSQKAARVAELVSELDAHIGRVSPRLHFVEQVESRINGLQGVLTDVERKLADQLARRAEAEAFRTQIDTIAALVGDAQSKLEGIHAFQQTILPMSSQVSALRSDIDAATEGLSRLQHEETVLAEQESRLSELLTSARAAATDVEERHQRVRSLSEELSQAIATKGELTAELSGIQLSQRDTALQIETSADQLKHVESALEQLNERRLQLATAEKTISAFETRLDELTAATAHVDKQIDGIAKRQGIVAAVKGEVEQVHQIGAQGRADLAYLVEHRSDVAGIKDSVDNVLSRITEIDEKLALVADRQRVVDEVEVKTQMITNLLADLHVNLEALGEQKSLVDHVSEKLARFDFLNNEAQNTLKTLQRERELAERIEQSIKGLRARSLPKGNGKSKST